MTKPLESTLSREQMLKMLARCKTTAWAILVPLQKIPKNAAKATKVYAVEVLFLIMLPRMLQKGADEANMMYFDFDLNSQFAAVSHSLAQLVHDT